MSVFCPNCGKEIVVNGSKFCDNCGTRLEVAAEVIENVPESEGKMLSDVPATEGMDAVAKQEGEASVPVLSESIPESMQMIPEQSDFAVAPTEMTTEQPVVTAAPVQPVQENVYAQPTYVQQPVQQPTYVQQPVQPAYYAEPQAKKKREKKRLGFGRRLLAFLLCILLFVSLLVTICYFSAKKSLTPEKIREGLEETENITELKVGNFVGGDVDEDTTLLEYIFDQIPEEQLKAYPDLTEENIEELLQNKAVQGIVSEAFGDVLGYFTGESDTLEIDPDKVIEALEDNSKLIEKYTGKKLLEEDYDEIREQIEDINENELADIEDERDSDFKKFTDISRFVFSDVFMYIVIGVNAFLILLIILACGVRFDVTMMHLGITGTLAGGSIFFGILLGTDKLVELIEDSMDEKILELVQSIVVDPLKKNGLIVLCIGGALIVGGIVWKVIRKVRN